MNGALLRPAIPRLHSLNLKYVDDLSMLAAINLGYLSVDQVTRQKPLAYNERTQQVLSAERNTLQEDLISLKSFVSKKLMKIKESKTLLMKFNFSRNLDFPPELMIEGFENNLQVVEKTKLLGVVISNDLKWQENTSEICKKAYKRMWVLRRMKILDVDPLVMLEVYKKEIRAVLELAVPAWNSGLTQKQISEIERVQRVAIQIILSNSKTGKSEFSYSMGLVILDLEPLDIRRENLCRTFARRTLRSKHSDIFNIRKNQHNTRLKKDYSENKCNTKRFYNSPVNYLTRLLNDK